MSELASIAVLAGVGVVAIVVALVVLTRSRVRVGSGQAAIVHNVGREPRVAMSDVLVFPWLGHAELVDLKVVVLEIARLGREGWHCADGIKVSVTLRFTVRIERTAEDIVKATSLVGADKVSDEDTLHGMFAAKFADAAASVVRRLEFQELALHSQELVDQTIMIIGSDLGGWRLDDVAIARIEQVPLELLDPTNILDAQAIAKITEETTRHRMRVAQLEAEAKRAEIHAALSAST